MTEDEIYDLTQAIHSVSRSLSDSDHHAIATAPLMGIGREEIESIASSLSEIASAIHALADAMPEK